MFFATRPEDVLSAVARHTGVSEDEIVSPSRSRQVVAARWLVVQLLASACHMSLPAIGRIVHLDHTSVHYQLHKARPELDADFGALELLLLETAAEL